MRGKRPAYRSYLLRVWRASGDEPRMWRMSLEESHTGERRGFAGLDQLIAFLEDQLGVSGDAPEAPARTPRSGIDHDS